MCGKAPPFRPALSMSGGCASSPSDSVNIYLERLIFQRATLPPTYTRPAVILSVFNKTGPHRILENVIHLLHEHVFAGDGKHIAMVIPERIAIGVLLGFMLELLGRCIMAVLFEMVNNAAAYDTVYVPQNLGRFEIAIGYRM
jgi:hypothetical protein